MAPLLQAPASRRLREHVRGTLQVAVADPSKTGDRFVAAGFNHPGDRALPARPLVDTPGWRSLWPPVFSSGPQPGVTRWNACGQLGSLCAASVITPAGTRRPAISLPDLSRSTWADQPQAPSRGRRFLASSSCSTPSGSSGPLQQQHHQPEPGRQRVCQHPSVVPPDWRHTTAA